MSNSECRKCHKQLVRGNRCDACRQKDRDTLKSIGMTMLAIVGGVAALAVPSIFKKK